MGFGTPPTPPTVLEGDYSTWTCKWKTGYDGSENDVNLLVRSDESLGKVFIINLYLKTFTIRALSDGAVDSVTALNIVGAGIDFIVDTVLRKYFAYIITEGGVPKLKVYKDGTLIQTIDLSVAPISWTRVAGDTYIISFSPDGKYIFIDNIVDDEYALFEGS